MNCRKIYNESKLDESKESVIGLAILIAGMFGLLKCSNNRQVKRLETIGAYDDYIKYNGKIDGDNGINEKKVFAYIAEACAKGMTVEEACKSYNSIPSIKRVAKIKNVEDKGDTYKVSYIASNGKFLERADITFPKSLENFESSSEGMEIDDVTFSFEESRLKESEYSERKRFSLTNPTEELEEIIEAIKDEYELEIGEKPNLEISYRNGGDIDIEFEDLDNSSASDEILKPICKKLADKADKLNIRLSAYANEISILTVEPFGPRGDFFEKVYNNHPENNLIPLENPTPEVKKIAEFIQDMMRAWHGRKDKGELYHHGYEIYYVFKTLNYNDAMELLNPIERELLGMYDDYIFGVGECRFGAYIDFYKKSDTEYYRSRGYK